MNARLVATRRLKSFLEGALDAADFAVIWGEIEPPLAWYQEVLESPPPTMAFDAKPTATFLETWTQVALNIMNGKLTTDQLRQLEGLVAPFGDVLPPIPDRTWPAVERMQKAHEALIAEHGEAYISLTGAAQWRATLKRLNIDPDKRVKGIPDGYGIDAFRRKVVQKP